MNMSIEDLDFLELEGKVQRKKWLVCCLLNEIECILLPELTSLSASVAIISISHHTIYQIIRQQS